MKHSPLALSRLWRGSLSGCAGLLFMAASAVSASAQALPDRNSGQVDPVTGYLCVGPGCQFLRMPDANCICKKENPNERNLRQLRLTCSTRSGGAWVACPVKPRHGISTN